MTFGKIMQATLLTLLMVGCVRVPIGRAKASLPEPPVPLNIIETIDDLSAIGKPPKPLPKPLPADYVPVRDQKSPLDLRITSSYDTETTESRVRKLRSMTYQ